MNTKKSQFLSAVRIIAPDDSFILNLAQCVSDDALPDFPGGAALAFVTSVSRMADASASPRLRALSIPPRKRLPCSFPRRRTASAIPVPIRHLCHGK